MMKVFKSEKDRIPESEIGDIALPNIVLGKFDNVDEELKKTYQSRGFIEAGKTMANKDALKNALATVESDIKNQDAANAELQQKAKDAINEAKTNAEADKAKIEQQITGREQQIKEYKGNIDKLESEIEDLKQHPEKINSSEVSKAGLYIGGSILLFMTVYLFIFYTSASYSAFFKKISENDLDAIITNSIFDSSALSHAWNSGFTSLLLVLTFTFIFLGLGFLIYQFGKQGGYIKCLKIGSLIVVTFIFDAILAYSIEKKVYEVQNMMSIEEKPDMTIGMAAQSVNFWLIIFSGFLVYIIWGFVFSFFMEEFSKLDKLQTAINAIQKKIDAEKRKLEEAYSHINELKVELQTVIAQIKNYEYRLSGGATFYINRIKGAVASFYVGWVSYMENAGMSKSDIDSCSKIKEYFDISIEKEFN